MTAKRMSDTDYSPLFSAVDIMDLEVHPAGRIAVCSVNKGRNWELAKIDLRTGTMSRFLAGDQSRSLMRPCISPSGDRVAYQVDFEGNENHDIFVVGENGRQPEKLTDGVEDNFEPQFSPSGDSIAFLSNREKDIENIYVMGSEGGKIKKLTDEPLPIKEFYWSPDNKTIVFTTGVGDEDTISLLDVPKAKSKKILAKRNVEYWLAGEYGGACPWLTNGRNFLFRTNEHDALDIAEFDLASKKSRWVVRSEKDKYQPQRSPDGHSISYLEVNDPDLVLKVKRGGRTTMIPMKDGVSRAARWLSDSSGIVFINGSSSRAEEVYVSRITQARRLSKLQSTRINKTLLCKPKLVKFRSFDGVSVAAQVSVPRDRSRRAGIVLPHGGPDMQDLNIWDQLPLMLVDKGFAVIRPNYRGSTGYGRRFNHLHDKDLGGGDFVDTVYAGKFLVESGLVREDRLGYWGASYSGFTCMLAMTKTPEMWAAGVSIVGFFDWETEMATERGYLKAYDQKKMGVFEDDPAFFKERSPIYFLKSIRAPLLMTASSRDVRCPPTESRAVVKRLRELGKSIEYHEYRDEGHWPRKRKNLKDLYERSARFLDKNIPG